MTPNEKLTGPLQAGPVSEANEVERQVRRMKTDWNDYGLLPIAHSAADSVLESLLKEVESMHKKGLNPGGILETALKEILWRIRSGNTRA